MSDNRKFEWKPGQRGSDIAIYLYEDENGEVLFRKVKTETGDPQCPKTFRCERFIGDRWTTKAGILDGVRKVPYRLPKFMNNSTVIITEGEKDCNNLADLGFSTTCCHCGAGEWPPEITPFFAGKIVYILYDVDTKCRANHPGMVAAGLYGTAKRIYIIDLEPHFLSAENLADIHEKDISDSLMKFADKKNRITAVQNLLREAWLYKPPEVAADES
jgi:hypothetical protein